MVSSSFHIYSILHTRCSFPGRVKILLKHKADCIVANNKRELPLHRACTSVNNIEVGVSDFKVTTSKALFS